MDYTLPCVWQNLGVEANARSFRLWQTAPSKSMALGGAACANHDPKPSPAKACIEIVPASRKPARDVLAEQEIAALCRSRDSRFSP
jgi:hypothetical protein